MSAFYDDGLHFSCRQCSYCCRHEPGYVFLSLSDMQQIAAFLDITIETCMRRYCREVNIGSMRIISLRETPDNDCIFWKESGCSIYPARPVQCVTYPFWPNILESREAWEKESLSCPGIGSGEKVSGETIRTMLDMREKNPPYMV